MKRYFSFQLHITDACDQRCQHCYIFSSGQHTELLEMSMDTLQDVLDNCLDMCSKVDREPYFYITGGDPLLSKSFWTFIEELQHKHIRFSIFGNPFHLNDSSCQKLKDLGCERYQLSLDGLKETHDSIRKKGSYETTLAKIPLLQKHGIRCAVMTTVSKTNMEEIPELIDVVVKSKADVFAFSRFCPEQYDASTHMEPLDYRDFLERCWQKFETHKESETTFYLKDHLWKLYLYEKGLFSIAEDLKEEIIYDGCHCADSHITILADGSVYACRRMESKVGDALQESIHDIFFGDKMDAYRAYHEFEKCSQCELLRFCRGCPAVAYGYSGNMYAPDPQCWKEV